MASVENKSLTEIAVAQKVSDKPVIDGVLDEAFWADAAWYSVASRQVATPLNNKCDFAVVWDDEYLYVGVKVMDEIVVLENLNPNIYNNDGIEIFIDPNKPNKDAKYDEKTIHFLYQVADGRWDIWGARGAGPALKTKFADLQVKHVLSDDGYTIEAAFPLAALGIDKPEDGVVIGFEVANNDDDNPASNADSDRGVLYWNDDTDHRNTDTWGNLCFYGKAKTVISNEGTAKIDGVLSDDEKWSFTSEAISEKMSYKVASLCDDKYLYLAIDLCGEDIDDASMNLLIDPDNKKSESVHNIQFINYSFKNNTMKYKSSKIFTASQKTETGYIFEAAVALELLEYKPKYLGTLGMEIEMFASNGDYEKPRLFWSHTVEENIWSKTAGYGSIVFNNASVGGAKNNPPIGNQISSHSIAVGQSVSGKANITDPDGDELTFRMDPNNEIPSSELGNFTLDSKSGEWSFTPAPGADLAETILDYFIEADDGKGGTFHHRVEIRIEPTPTFLTYHVDGDNGSDENDGLSRESALRSIFAAADKVCPGDTVLIHESEVPYCYEEKKGLVLSRSGLADAYITYKAADGERPVIDVGCNWTAVKIIGSYINFDGLTVKGLADTFMPDMPENYKYYYQSYTGGGLHPNVTKFNTNGIAVTHEDHMHVRDRGIDKIKLMHHVNVTNCVVDYLGGGGIVATGCDYVTIANNTITNCGWGDMWATSGISVLGTIDIDDNFNEHKIRVLNNITAGNRHFAPWISIKKFSDGNGIIIDSTKNEHANAALLKAGDKYGVRPYGGKFLVANNLSYYNGGSGIHAFDAENVDMINNTVFANSSTPSLGYNDFFSNAANNVNMFNNIVYSRTGAPLNISSATSSNVVYDNNLFYNYSANNNVGEDILGRRGKAGTTAGKNNIIGKDPLFKKACEVNYDTGIAYPDDWEAYMYEYAKDGGYFIGADYNVNKLGFDFNLCDESPALGGGNKEWSDKLGNTENRMGVFGTIGSYLRPVTIKN